MIDRATVDRIKEAANIVDVVSEFVTLKKSGANYKGLCPFHDEKTPSFMVSPARGSCHCFGCGKGGNPVSFIMEHEQLTYPEALRWLAKKYGIEIHEREISDQERQEQNERESMFIVNEWAATYFEELLHNDPDGVAIGMQYYRGRGFRDDVIRKFRLGYDVKDRHAFAANALQKGYKEEFLLKTGICYKSDRGELIDRYADRVIFPWIGLSGKIVGFSARVLDSRTKGVQQKYVNSPDSEIYHKERELFGIYQAKRAIAKEDRVYIVEGQTDVLSMHQCGIENVVANSGTALSIHQIHMLHRFSSNITLLYDGDDAGMHAAMRGTDMLLSEGMNVKVLFLPDGDDPDSFARKHTAADFRQYIDDHQMDFLQFKTDMLVSKAKDSQQRSEGIDSIIRSIAVIPNQILRATYLHDSALLIGMKEDTLINRMNTFIHERKTNTTTPTQAVQRDDIRQELTHSEKISHVERMIAQLVVRHGERMVFHNVETEDSRLIDISVAQFIYYNLAADDIKLKDPQCAQILQEAAEKSGEQGFVAETYFVNHHNIELGNFANELAVDRFALIETNTDDTPVSESQKKIDQENEETKLRSQAEHLTLDLRMDIVQESLEQLKKKVIMSASDSEKMREAMTEYQERQSQRNELARRLGLKLT